MFLFTRRILCFLYLLYLLYLHCGTTHIPVTDSTHSMTNSQHLQIHLGHIACIQSDLNPCKGRSWERPPMKTIYHQCSVASLPADSLNYSILCSSGSRKLFNEWLFSEFHFWIKRLWCYWKSLRQSDIENGECYASVYFCSNKKLVAYSCTDRQAGSFCF